MLDREKELKYLNSESHTISFVPLVLFDFQLLNDSNLVSKKDPFDGLNHASSLGGLG